MHDLVCMDCGNILMLNATACACGWRKHPGAVIRQTDYRCVYIQDGEPCHADGRISRTCKGNGDWYCSNHWYIY